ncbi:hypothetical protein RND81_03G086100 [Saponaria officinalis]|uniref:Transposase n=1 Tax=Saponaria officinalis TaxID=3572 RepID=A0AAW1M5Z1_SAPOF
MGEKRKRDDKDENKPGERGATKCPEALAAIAAKKPLTLAWNSKGLPTGPNARTLSSFIGVTTKLFATIDVDDFRKLNPKLKKLLLERLKEAFDIPECYDQYLLKKAAASLRQWRCDVAEHHLYVNKETGEMKKNPPSKYPNITQDQWDNFKENRASERFKAISKRNRANIAKKESIYYGSRGGYRLIEDILKKEQGVEEVERHVTYKAGHTPKGARVGTKYDTNIISNIEEVLKEVEEGDFIPKGRDDILARAIGRPEHPGRLRGVPLHVGVTKYYGKTTSKKNKKKTSKYTDQMVQVLVSVILKMNAGGKPSEEELKMMEDIIKEGKEQGKMELVEEADKMDIVVAEKEADMVVTGHGS